MAPLLFWIALLPALGVLALVLVVALCRHWRPALRNALINSALALGLAYLLLGPFGWLMFPGVLAFFLAVGSLLHASELKAHGAPPRYLRLYPTRGLPLLLVFCLVSVAAQRAFTWRLQAQTQVATQISVPELMTIAQASPQASTYLRTYFAQQGREEIAPKDLIAVCGSVLRYAESDQVQASLTEPANRICRASHTYSRAR